LGHEDVGGFLPNFMNGFFVRFLEIGSGCARAAWKRSISFWDSVISRSARSLLILIEKSFADGDRQKQKFPE
jgi:hypothetical protein